MNIGTFFMKSARTDPGKNRAKFRTTCINQDGKIVVDGIAWAMPPKEE